VSETKNKEQLSSKNGKFKEDTLERLLRLRLVTFAVASSVADLAFVA
jgi:hypothetical protein